MWAKTAFILCYDENDGMVDHVPPPTPPARLRRGFSAGEARRQHDVAVDWGRYGDLFEYEAETGKLVPGSDPAKVGA